MTRPTANANAGFSNSGQAGTTMSSDFSSTDSGGVPSGRRRRGAPLANTMPPDGTAATSFDDSGLAATQPPGRRQRRPSATGLSQNPSQEPSASPSPTPGDMPPTTSRRQRTRANLNPPSPSGDSSQLDSPRAADAGAPSRRRRQMAAPT